MNVPSASQGHGGTQALTVARAHGVDTVFTLSGAHIFPLYDAAVASEGAVRLIDVRHEQTAVFAAEALARLTRRPTMAAVTAGPGVTNTVSAVTTAWFNDAPVLVLGGRAPAYRWGSGALQELDHPPLLAPVTKSAVTVSGPAHIAGAVDDALALAGQSPRGPVFVDVPMDYFFSPADPSAGPVRGPVGSGLPAADPADLGRVVALLESARRPVVVVGSDVWQDGAEHAARSFVETLGLPTITNGMGRGVLPAEHPLLVTRARSLALGEADLVVVVGTPLDFRLGYGDFGSGTTGDTHPTPVVHLVGSPQRLARHTALAAGVCGPLTDVLDALSASWSQSPDRDRQWSPRLAHATVEARVGDQALLRSPATPIHPARVYGELIPRLTADAVVIGDGGDFVSFAGRFIEPAQPGRWLDPGPFGCLGTGLGYAIAARLAHPDSPVVLLLGDGAAGFSLMDVDTLVRHRLPVVMVVGNNSAWGLEKHPMRALYGYDVAAQLAPHTRYDEVVTALGGAGELVTDPDQIGPALDRAFASGVPYLVNVVTDPEVPYPRTTTGV
ncbi:MAG: acetolactate synthase [Actinomycetes bacterium]